MIYFLQSVDGGPVKIGTTEDLAVRWKALEADYGCELALLAIMPGGKDEEAEVHERFAAIRLGRTEQFRPTADLMAFIGRPLLVGLNPDTVEVMGSHRKPMIVQVRGSQEFKDWAEKLSRHERISLASIVERAMQMYAKAVGFPDEPPER
jgi:hypothetical protein